MLFADKATERLKVRVLVARAEWPEVKDYAHRLAQAVAQSDPDTTRIVSNTMEI